MKESNVHYNFLELCNWYIQSCWHQYYVTKDTTYLQEMMKALDLCMKELMQHG